MKFEQYKFKFYLNANHAILIHGHLGQIHPHTWEISIITLKLDNQFIRFSEVEALVDKMIERYQDKLLNEIYPFDTINPTLENICEVFKNEIQQILEKSGWRLLSIEVSETPARSYVINLSDEENFFRSRISTAQIDKQSKEQLVSDIINEVKYSHLL